ncbi:V-type proton ATPase subunit C [Astathelohania contejeani]|uniref:V-type proton ATPase subunit C n=1 Tax=Astathelohania contejeani TaxID=164912 RepID=A0ABQ7I1X3_9MICR|nr:V-type proton ATPase subunit C [Thelohania contejeani]
MYVFVALPSDSENPLSEQLVNIRKKITQETELLSMPRFWWNSFENAIGIIDNLETMETTAKSTIRMLLDSIKMLSTKQQYKNYLDEINFDYAIKTFNWSEKRYNPEFTSDELLEELSKTLMHLKNLCSQRIDAFILKEREYKEADKQITGNLSEIDISSILKQEDINEDKDDVEDGFIKNYFVVSRKADVENMLTLFKSIEAVCNDTITKVTEDAEFVLYRFMGLISKEKEIEVTLRNSGFTMKEVNNQKVEENLKRRCNIISLFDGVKSNHRLFLSNTVKEIFDVMMHAKMVKLFVECVMQYGLPTNYVYFVSSGKKNRILTNWKKVVLTWDSIRISHGLGEKANPEDLLAFSELEIQEEEEEK